MQNEIGSEFHSVPLQSGVGLVFPKNILDSVLTFSGRTAIETVLKNIPKPHKAMLPSYCCDSIIMPFREADIEICFFEVAYQERLWIDLTIPDDVDLLFWCNYFGFHMKNPDLHDFKKRGGIVVEDITHCFFSQKEYVGDYLVASLRKWEPVYCGGYCGAVKGSLGIKPSLIPPWEFICQKKAAMELKARYLIDCDETKKSIFLAMFQKSNQWLAKNYSSLAIDEWSKKIIENVDETEQWNTRRRNAHILLEGIQKHPYITPLFKEEDMECPLFVPVIVGGGRRDQVRRELINERIYCPIHWTRPDSECESNLYDMELSLICDQRYGEKDMERIISVLGG